MIKVTDRVIELITPFLNEHNLRAYDILFFKEREDKILRLYIDKKDGFVSIDDCETVSKHLSDILDREDFINERYILEVSSAGIERLIKYDWHFNEAIGKKVSIKLFSKIDNKKVIVGELLSGGEKKDIEVKVDKKTLNIKSENIAEVRIYFEFGGSK